MVVAVVVVVTPVVTGSLEVVVDGEAVVVVEAVVAGEVDLDVVEETASSSDEESPSPPQAAKRRATAKQADKDLKSVFRVVNLFISCLTLDERKCLDWNLVMLSTIASAP